jgi:hypothetical protein
VLPYGLFIKTVTYAAMSLFMFGYHVHEKAILVTLLPLTMILSPSNVSGTKGAGGGAVFSNVLERERWHAVFLQVTAAGVVSLLPLLINPEEQALKGAHHT